jgi:4-hydroxybenzoate polyprenyltransferase
VLATVRNYLSLIRFGHTIFALPFALLSALMAWRLQYALEVIKSLREVGLTEVEIQLEVVLDAWMGWTSGHSAIEELEKYRGFAIRWQEVVGILLCMVTARSAAMAFNRLADRQLDATNPRTAGRHLPAGILTTAQVTVFAASCGIAFVASTLLFLPNRLPLYLSVPVLVFLLGYSYAKRFTALAHFWLGTALALSPVAAWTAIRGETVLQRPADLLPALVLGGAVLVWVAGFDIIYACQDVEHDRQEKLHSVPVRLGVAGALRLAAACHFATMMLLACLPLVFPLLGGIYFTGVAVVGCLVLYEHSLVRPNNLARVNTAFFNVNAIISLGLLLVGSLDLWIS